MHSTSSSPTDVAQAAATTQPAFRAHAVPSPERCRHCDTSLAGRYCHACGEDSTPPETSWQSWVGQWHRLVRTLRSLWLEPGHMAVQQWHGIRVGYIPPFTLFLNAVALFFLFSAATQFQLTTLAEQSGPWMAPMIEERMAASGLSRELVLERAERRFQGIYTLCLAVISGIGYTLVYRLLFRRSLPGWKGAFTLSLYYLAFLFTVSLPAMLLLAPLRDKFGGGATMVIVVFGLAVAAAWNTAAARRIGAHRWPMAVAKGLAVVVAGFVIDGVMSVAAIWLTLRFT
jgi:Protein of unknown function (DUF3667)